jgi:hypothetical protein
MHVVADASPLRYLILIGLINLLPTLFTRIIPCAVLGELCYTFTRLAIPHRHGE